MELCMEQIEKNWESLTESQKCSFADFLNAHQNECSIRTNFQSYSIDRGELGCADISSNKFPISILKRLGRPWLCKHLEPQPHTSTLGGTFNKLIKYTLLENGKVGFSKVWWEGRSNKLVVLCIVQTNISKSMASRTLIESPWLHSMWKGTPICGFKFSNKKLFMSHETIQRSILFQIWSKFGEWKWISSRG